MPTLVEFHPDAARDVSGAFRWYQERNAASASAFALEIDIAIERISSSPDRWPKLLSDLRRYLLKRFPFSVIYRLHDRGIEIVAVAHERRRPGYWESS